MSNGFTPAKPADAAPETAPDPSPPNPLLEVAAMGEEIVQALSDIATMIPSLGPIQALANRIKERCAGLRAAVDPPK